MSISGWSTFTSASAPALDVWRGGGTGGPRVLITAGVHGDEYEGPAAVLEVTRRLGQLPLSGSVVALPVTNPLALEAGTRLTPDDGLNLARTFPGDLQGSVTERLAATVFDHFARHCDYVIDLHSGGVEYVFVPVAGFYGSPGPGNPSFEAAARSGLGQMWQLPENRGVLSLEASRLGKVCVGHEYLGAGQLSRQGVERYTEAVLSHLRFWGLLHDQPPLEPAGSVFVGDWQLAPASGLFIAHRALGDTVRTGDLIAEVQPIRGAAVPINAQRPGTLLGLRSKAWIKQDNWAILIGSAQEAPLV